MSEKDTSHFSGRDRVGIECHDCVSTNNQAKEKSPITTITIGVDLAKLVFSTCTVDISGRMQKREDFNRSDFAAWLAQVPAGTVVAMEACSGAHHSARRCLEYGLQPRLMAAQFVTPFRKSRTAKNDRNDAEAIATVARQGNMRFVAVKTVDQQARLAWHRGREGYKTESLAVSNRLRGLLAAHRRRLGGDGGIGARLQERSAIGGMAWACTDAALERKSHATRQHQLSRRFVLAHPVDSRRPQQCAAGAHGAAREGHSRAGLDPDAGPATAVRQAAGRDCQQARAAAVGDAGAGRRLRCKCVEQTPDAATCIGPANARSTLSETEFFSTPERAR